MKDSTIVFTLYFLNILVWMYLAIVWTKKNTFTYRSFSFNIWNILSCYKIPATKKIYIQGGHLSNIQSQEPIYLCLNPSSATY